MPVQVQEAFRTPNRKTGKELPLPCYNKIINMQIKEKCIERGRENADSHRKAAGGQSNRDYSKETLKARRSRNDVFQFLKGKSCRPGLLYPAKLPLIIGGKPQLSMIKIEGFIPGKATLQKILEGVLQVEDKNKSIREATRKSKPC